MRTWVLVHGCIAHNCTQRTYAPLSLELLHLQGIAQLVKILQCTSGG